MLQNYLRIALRNLWKQRGYTFINLFGMAVGMACCFLLLVYVNHELHYDEFHPNGDRIYRVSYHANFSGSTFELVRIPAPIAPMMKEQFPQVEQVARMYPRSITLREVGTDKPFEIEQAMFADSTVQQVFSFDFLQGDPETALERPFSLVLTDETAQRVFGTTQIIGRQVLLANEGPFTVTGVIRAFPDQAHIHFDLLAPFRNMVDVEAMNAREMVSYVINSNWIASHSHTYVLLKNGADPREVDSAFPAFLQRFGMKDFIEKQAFTLFAVPDIHTHSTAQGGAEPGADLNYLRIFATIGFLILLIASINFINLSTATYLGRVKEVGVRKVLGAARSSLISQFMGETILLSFFSFLIALMLLDLLLPYFGALMDKTLVYHPFHDGYLSMIFVATFLVSGILAGSYPAFFVSKFKPTEIFQSKGGRQKGGSDWLRKALITTQFAVGIALISSTYIVLAQLNFWRSQPLGFKHEQIVTVPISSNNMNSLFAPGDSTLRARLNTFEDRLLQNANISHVTLAAGLPGFGAARHPITTDQVSLEDNVFLQSLSVDYDFSETFDLHLLAGRDFDKAFGTDHLSGFIINELAMKTLKWNAPEEAIGKKITRGGKTGNVVGVIQNFHTSGLQQALEPLILEVTPGMFNTFAIRLQNQSYPETLKFIEKTWREAFPEKAFEYRFLDEQLADIYAQERQLAGLVGNFAGIAIFLSCFGLFGLISLSVRQRAKEIGIRKILGASVPGIIGLLSRDFLKLVAIAMLAATPVAWFFMDQWMEDFAYRIDLHWWHFVLAGASAMLVAFLTTGFQSAKAALANPIESLRNE